MESQNPEPQFAKMDKNHNTFRKQIQYYFYEFLMLFIAVFCGFLADNWRENISDRGREKQFVKSLLVDIHADTAEMNKSILAASIARRSEVSVIFYLHNNPPFDFVSQHFIDLDFRALGRLRTVFNEVTALQLKNSGNLTLIQNPEVIRKISLYWNGQENIRINLNRYLEYRNRGRELAERLFNFSDYTLVRAGLIKLSPKGVRVINSDPRLWAEYANIIDHCETTNGNYTDGLKDQIKLARQLVILLEKEYNFD